MKSRIETAIKLPINCQLLIWNKSLISDDILVTDFQTTAESPILLLNSESTKIRAILPVNSIKFPELANTPTNCETDAQTAKQCASMAYCIQRNIEKCVLNHRLAITTPSYVMSVHVWHNFFWSSWMTGLLSRAMSNFWQRSSRLAIICFNRCNTSWTILLKC